MNKRLAIFLVALVVLAALAYVTWNMTAEPYQEGMIGEEAKAHAEDLKNDPEAYAALLQQARTDLAIGSEWDTLDVWATEGNYFYFGANMTEGGGVRILAYRNNEGVFELINMGQDIPNCSEVERAGYLERPYDVPSSLAPECLELAVKRR